MSPLDYLDPMQSGLPITLLWLGMCYCLWRFITRGL
jgi:hypothetical protein